MYCGHYDEKNNDACSFLISYKYLPYGPYAHVHVYVINCTCVLA